ncbi:MAG TPA: hypothetical protein VKJ65_07650, partial [Phycisphaerae bacterium]|nr:hypothetical protein [Phycisphaerae bacterium]
MRSTLIGVNAVVATALAFALSAFNVSKASAGVIEFLDWQPVPNSTLPEINYTASNLQTGPGAISNGDGNLSVQTQTPGGLEADTILTAPVPFSFQSSIFTGGTGYYDTSLTFTGLAPTGNAKQTIIAPGVVQDSQALSPGTFTITATTAIGQLPPILLTGTIAGATIVTGVDGGSAGAVFNAAGVNYTGGAVLAAFPSNWVTTNNDLSISMTAITPPLGISAASMQLNPFTA